jgi:hypothetical protein
MMTFISKPRGISMDLFIKSVWADHVLQNGGDPEKDFCFYAEVDGEHYHVKVPARSLAMRWASNRLRQTVMGFSLN